MYLIKGKIHTFLSSSDLFLWGIPEFKNAKSIASYVRRKIAIWE